MSHHSDIKKPVLPRVMQHLSYPVFLVGIATFIGYSFAQAMH
tara:strand:- start:4446 stop:4571 length:126 start_codon:yes stop_codon:yes gene_type:complete